MNTTHHLRRRVNSLNQTGFTIVELLIVIVVIGILTSVTVVAFNGIQSRAYETKVSTIAKNYMKALVAYRAENGRFPFESGFHCVGSASDYPADGEWSDGQCTMNVFNQEGIHLEPNGTDVQSALASSGMSGLSVAGIKPVTSQTERNSTRRGLYYTAGANGSKTYVHIEYWLSGDRDCKLGGYEEESWKELLENNTVTSCVLGTSTPRA